MIDKSKRKATVENTGSMTVIRMTGGPDCLWLNMYLDKAAGAMTCDSDIGSYAYHWGRSVARNESFLAFCCRWLSDDEWLLRKCIGERHEAKAFDVGASVTALREAFIEYNGEDADTADLEEVLDEAKGYSDDAGSWSVAVHILADEWSLELPDEWYQCIVRDYTPWQKRFAEICREVIVPELRRIVDGQQVSVRPCNTCEHSYWHDPECSACNEKNGFKYYEARMGGGVRK